MSEGILSQRENETHNRTSIVLNGREAVRSEPVLTPDFRARIIRLLRKNFFQCHSSTILGQPFRGHTGPLRPQVTLLGLKTGRNQLRHGLQYLSLEDSHVPVRGLLLQYPFLRNELPFLRKKDLPLDTAEELEQGRS